MTPFLQNLDPDGSGHALLGARLAEVAFGTHPSGDVPAEVVDILQKSIAVMMVLLIESSGGEQSDQAASAALVREHFNTAYSALCFNAAPVAGHA